MTWESMMRTPLRSNSLPHAHELGLEDADVEAADVEAGEVAAGDEGVELVGDLGEVGSLATSLLWMPWISLASRGMRTPGLRRQVCGWEMPPSVGRQLDHRDLDHAVVGRVGAGRFGVEEDQRATETRDEVREARAEFLDGREGQAWAQHTGAWVIPGIMPRRYGPA
jgi:hypothetical protein